MKFTSTGFPIHDGMEKSCVYQGNLRLDKNKVFETEEQTPI